MSTDSVTLGEVWRLRNAAAVTLGLSEDQMRRTVRDASVEALLGLLETFSPARSTGPDWTRTFEPLVERLWLWRDDATMAALSDAFAAKGPAWAGVAHALSPEEGARIRKGVRHPAWARLPAFTSV
ncbi:MAG: hypothetical protein AB7S57_16435 [Acetobacteraceae bacterium]